MAKSQRNQTFVLKINTGYLSNHNWDLTLNLKEIRKQPQMVVSLGSSQVLRWIEEMQNRNNDYQATYLKQQIKRLKKNDSTVENLKKIREKYDELYVSQFQQDYMMLVMDTENDYIYACNHGFYITIDYGNGTVKTVKYRRFLGTAGSIKKSTIMFVNEDIYDKLMIRINNGRYQGPSDDDESVKMYNDKELKYKFIPAKLNAYFALQCSASICVGSFNDENKPFPKIIVVDDAISRFKTKVRMVHDEGMRWHPQWPYAEDACVREIEYNVSDGMGFITPELSAKWAQLLDEGSEPLSGFNTRCAFLKGMVFTIPFKEFADEIAHNYEIIDAWGDKQDIRDADLILTVSMLKLWDSYAGINDYIDNCRKNNYEFCIAKSAPHELRNVHTTNYQYLQDFDLTDSQIDDLINPTVTKIKECLGLDWKKLILYTCGTELNDENVKYIDPIYKSIMVQPEIVDDEYVRNKIARMLQKRVNSAKIGVLDVEGDYAILGNDPYYLLQNIFNLPTTGLLKEGECYHKYWYDKNVDEVIVFRAPMTSHENVCKLKVVNRPEMEKWYRYIKTCCFINAYDTTAIRLNGADYDSDTVFTTNNKILLETFKYKPTLMCDQSSMPKVRPTEEDYISSDINGFGDTIGSVTNKATNMISLRAGFDKNSEEYKILTSRIDTMMNYQQNAIDRIKGVVAKPVPREWLDPKANKIKDEDDEETIKTKELYQSVAADKKPWFFIYRYSEIKSELNKYMKNVRKNCKIRFGKTLEELYNNKGLTEEEKTFIYNYEKYLPVSRAPSTMNRICWKIEDEFNDMDVLPNAIFDYSVLKNNDGYTDEEYKSLDNIFTEYNKSMQTFLKGVKANDSNKEDRDRFVKSLKETFLNECNMVSNNLNHIVNALIDICYKSNKSKSFVWELFGEQIFNNLLACNNNTLTYPIKNPNGDILFYGERFSLVTQEIGGEENVNFE